jgi:hypothetical protein
MEQAVFHVEQAVFPEALAGLGLKMGARDQYLRRRRRDLRQHEALMVAVKLGG